MKEINTLHEAVFLFLKFMAMHSVFFSSFPENNLISIHKVFAILFYYVKRKFLIQKLLLDQQYNQILVKEISKLNVEILT